jgi:Fe-S cluster assembly protein SufD
MRTTINPTQAAQQKFLAAFEEFDKAVPARPWLAAKRRHAIGRVAELGFPTTRDEEWKYTDITPAVNLAVTPLFQVAYESHVNGSAQKLRAALPFPQLASVVLTFVDGHYAPELSDLSALPSGVEVTSLSQALAADSELVQEHFGRTVDAETEVFTALNTAFAQDGAFIRVPSNTVVEVPIQLVFIGTGEGSTVTHPRNLFLLGNTSEVTVIESYVSSTDAVYFTNSVTEVICGAGAKLEHIKVQLESEKAFHIGTSVVVGSRDTVARSHSINFGGRLVRNNATALMGDQNAEITLNGLVVAGGDQHIDNHTAMDHAQPHCNSHEVYTHVLDGHANGVFNGKIFVRLDAQKTDAKQSNRTLLLSPDAQVNAKPQLEIFADDVKCTHGATIGQLDENAMFYLRARGIPEDGARRILIHAFASEVLEGIDQPEVVETLEGLLHERLD